MPRTGGIAAAEPNAHTPATAKSAPAVAEGEDASGDARGEGGGQGADDAENAEVLAWQR